MVGAGQVEAEDGTAVGGDPKHVLPSESWPIVLYPAGHGGP